MIKITAAVILTRIIPLTAIDMEVNAQIQIMLNIKIHRNKHRAQYFCRKKMQHRSAKYYSLVSASRSGSRLTRYEKMSTQPWAAAICSTVFPRASRAVLAARGSKAKIDLMELRSPSVVACNMGGVLNSIRESESRPDPFLLHDWSQGSQKQDSVPPISYLRMEYTHNKKKEKKVFYIDLIRLQECQEYNYRA